MAVQRFAGADYRGSSFLWMTYDDGSLTVKEEEDDGSFIVTEEEEWWKEDEEDW